MGATKIEWADSTWNPLRARRLDDGKVGWHCEKVSAGCAHCYAETFNGRRLPGGGTGLEYSNRHRAEVGPFVDDGVLLEPLRWRKPRRVFVCSMTDLFGEWVSDEQIDHVIAVMALAERHTFMVLTKRAERMRQYVTTPMRANRILAAMVAATPDAGVWVWPGRGPCPPNIWLGVSVEDQRAADERIPHLIATPAAARFVSAEPLLGPIDLDQCGATPCEAVGRGPDDFTEPQAWPGVDWVIVGGESGPGARPCYVEDVRAIVEQTRAARIACFVKQLGARCYSMPYRGSERKWAPEEALDPNGEAIEELGKILGASRHLVLRSAKGGDPAEWPADLRVREFPQLGALAERSSRG